MSKPLTLIEKLESVKLPRQGRHNEIIDKAIRIVKSHTCVWARIGFGMYKRPCSITNGVDYSTSDEHCGNCQGRIVIKEEQMI